MSDENTTLDLLKQILASTQKQEAMLADIRQAAVNFQNRMDHMDRVQRQQIEMAQRARDMGRP